MSDEGARLADRIHVLQSAHAMASRPDAERDEVVRFLREPSRSDVVPEDDDTASPSVSGEDGRRTL